MRKLLKVTTEKSKLSMMMKKKNKNLNQLKAKAPKRKLSPKLIKVYNNLWD